MPKGTCTHCAPPNHYANTLHTTEPREHIVHCTLPTDLLNENKIPHHRVSTESTLCTTEWLREYPVQSFVTFLNCAPPYQYTSTLYTTESVSEHIVHHRVREHIVHHRVSTRTHCTPHSQYANTLYTTESICEHIVHHRVSTRTHCTLPSQYANTLYTTESVHEHIVHHRVSTRTHCTPPSLYANTLYTTESEHEHNVHHRVSTQAHCVQYPLEHQVWAQKIKLITSHSLWQFYAQFRNKSLFLLGNWNALTASWSCLHVSNNYKYRVTHTWPFVTSPLCKSIH